MKKKTEKKGNLLITAGGILLFMALILAGGNWWESKSAGANAQELLEMFLEETALQTDEQSAVFENTFQGEMIETSALKKDEDNSIYGVLEFPKEGLELPVLEICTKENLKKAPCLFRDEEGRSVIAGHNYKTHFGGLSTMSLGETVYLTTGDGQRKSFLVTEVTKTEGADAWQLDEGEWDLTLFTCTLGGKDRILVRCMLAE